jgi:hypothetical protein
MSSVLTSTSIIDTNSHDAAEMEAQVVANKMADAIVDAIVVKQSMPNVEIYTETIQIPLDLAGFEYYIEIDDTNVYVNTTDGEVSRRSTYYSTSDLDFTLHERIRGQSEWIKISYTSPTYVYRLDFGTDDSPVKSGYFKVTDSTLKEPLKRDPPWWSDEGDYPYPYRVPITIHNPNSEALDDIPIKLVITQENASLSEITIVDNFKKPRANCVFIDHNDPADQNDDEIIDSCIDYWYTSSRDELMKVVFYVQPALINAVNDKKIYLYYGGSSMRSHKADNVAEFYDTFECIYGSWNQEIDGNLDDDEPWSLAISSDDQDIYFAGCGTNLEKEDSELDWWIKKFHYYGGEYSERLDWDKSFDGSSGDDVAMSVAVDDGSVYVVGYGTGLVGSGSDWWIKKFDSSGNEIGGQWEDMFFDGGDSAVAYSVAVDGSDGSVYVVGYKEVSDEGKNWWIKKFDSNGDEDTANWNKGFDGGSDDVAMSVAVDDGSVYVVGYGTNLVDDDPASGKDWWIKKFDSDGTEIFSEEPNLGWNKKYDGEGSDDIAQAVAVDDNGNVYVCGYGTNLEFVNPKTKKDWWLKKFTSEGEEIDSPIGINDEIWDFSDIDEIYTTNEFVGSGVQLDPGQWITTKPDVFTLPEPAGSENIMYMIEAEFNDLQDEKNSGELFFLREDEGKDYTDDNSYSLILEQATDLTTNFNLMKYGESVRDSVEIPSIPYLQDIRVRAYLYLDGLNPSNPQVYLNGFLYDSTLFVPYHNSVSYLDKNPNEIGETAPYLSGEIGLACPSTIEETSCRVEWIRVLKTAFVQPTYSIGVWESINFGWKGDDNRRTANDAGENDPFSPDPKNRDFIKVPKPKEVGSNKYNSDFYICNLPAENYLITVTVGDLGDETPECDIQWTTIDPGTGSRPDLDEWWALTVPKTGAGELRNVYFTISVPQGETKDVIIAFDKFPIGYGKKAVEAITVEITEEVEESGHRIRCEEALEK